MSTKDKIGEAINEWHRQQDECLQHALRWCESPIEQLFLMALLTNGWSLDLSSEPHLSEMDVEAAVNDLGINHGWRFIHGEPGVIVAQAGVRIEERDYRIDFAMLVGDERFAIELDGHDFHERTKEQARRDKSRDRALVKDGWKVVRFTGSEVFADATDVAEQVFSLGMDALERRENAVASKRNGKAR